VFRRHERFAARFLTFARERDVHEVSPHHPAPAWLVAEFLLDVVTNRGDSAPLERPESTIKQASAAVSLLDGRGPTSAVNSIFIQMFKKGLIKDYTRRPIAHRPALDLVPLLQHWRLQPDNRLPERELRCKAVGLLAIVRGGRPSDIAQTQLRREDFAFNDAGELTSASPIYLHGKTDQLRRGSEHLPIPASSNDTNCDFVHTAWAYFKCTTAARPAAQHFVLTLPRRGIGRRRHACTADTVARIMRDFAAAAGVQATASAFRPAVVTRALQLGYPMHLVARLTGHKSLDVLQRHYNRSQLPTALMTALQNPDSDDSGDSDDSDDSDDDALSASSLSSSSSQ